jgi:hypothetical protein
MQHRLIAAIAESTQNPSFGAIGIASRASA